MPFIKGGSQASSAVMAGLSCDTPKTMEGGRRRMKGGAAACSAEPSPDLLNQYVGMTPSTVPVGAPSMAPGALDYSSVPASTLGVLNAELSSFGVLPNVFSTTPNPFTPPLLIGGAKKWHCKYCKMVSEQLQLNNKGPQKRRTKQTTPKKTK
jgi:hypothetical protein